jgi:hypothetical protein
MALPAESGGMLGNAPQPEGALPDTAGLLKVLNNTQLDDVKRQQDLVENKLATEPIPSLLSYLKKHWEAAKNAKFEIEHRLLKCKRQRQGQYDPTDLAHIRAFGGSTIFMMLTNAKCRAIESWIRDIMIPAGEKPWSIDPTPEVDIPEEKKQEIQMQIEGEITLIMQTYGPDTITPQMINDRYNEIAEDQQNEEYKSAKKECRMVEKKVDDSLTEGKFYDEFSMFIKDFATYPTAFMKGPEVRREKSLKWEEKNGKTMPVLDWVYRRTYKRVSAFDLYFSPGARHINDGYMFERLRLRAIDIMKMKGVPGFHNASINEVLYNYNQEGIDGAQKDWLWTDQERANLENRQNEQTDPQAIINALLYYGEIPGKLLKEWGLKDKRIKNEADVYPAIVMFVDRWVIMARINDDPFGYKPYYSASYDPSNESIWGTAPPEILEDCQRACNAVARALINNAAMASGPQVEVHRDRVDPSENIQRIVPWKIWKTKSDPVGKNRQALNFYQPSILSAELMGIYQHFFNQAGEQLGVPAYESGIGSAAGGAGKTAHGLSMLMNASSKILKDSIYSIDRGIIKPIVYSTWMHTIIYDEIDYAGDINIVARASEYLIVAEQLQARRMEFLGFTNNPVDMAIVGYDGRAKVLRETAKSMKLDDDVVPGEGELEERIASNMQAQAMGMPAGGGGGGAAVSGLGAEMENPLMPPMEKLAQK